MPLVKRCVICGRIADIEYNAYPYKKNGVACPLCYQNRVLPAIKDKETYYKRKYMEQKWTERRLAYGYSKTY